MRFISQHSAFNRKAFMKGCLFLLLLLGKYEIIIAGNDGGVEEFRSGKPMTGIVSTSDVFALSTGEFSELDYSSFPLSTAQVSRTIKNIITFKVIEENNFYISEDFSAKATVKIEYGPNSGSLQELTQNFTVEYKKGQGIKYNAIKYFHFENAEFVRITLEAIDAPVIGGLDTRKILHLENSMRITRYFQLPNTVLAPVYVSDIAMPQSMAIVPDRLYVSWQWHLNTGHNATQLEWAWVEDELAPYYETGGNIDYDLVFESSSRVDLAYNKDNYDIPLLYDGAGKLYYRIRAINFQANGTRSNGPWTDPAFFTFSTGHNNSLNWQATTSFAEEGKQKSIVQYFDGSLRSRQTVTKDNEYGVNVTSETFYDGQGRPAIQILPTPGIDNVIAYQANLNLFNTQAANQDPAELFDMQPVATPNSLTPPLSTTTGSAQYYSINSPYIGETLSGFVPDAAGYPYTVTRYTEDGTGRILKQSGVGEQHKMGSGHETKYYYGTAAQEELDGLFGTEVGYYTHYSKNMVRDANGQMSVSYVDMHGRTIATALAGESPDNLQPLETDNDSYYPGQAGTLITRNLLDNTTNIATGNTIESVNTILVPARTTYTFLYDLDPNNLEITACEGSDPPIICYDCLYDLEIAITDESGETEPIIKNFSNVSLNPDDDCSTATPQFVTVPGGLGGDIEFSVLLEPGSYSVRKTLSMSESSFEKYKILYATKAMCKTEQEIYDSVLNVLLTTSNCAGEPPLTCENCISQLGSEANFRAGFRVSLGLNPFETATPEIEQAITNAWNNSVATCNKLCTNTSQSLPTIRKLMLLDMVPYSGQYAKENASENTTAGVFSMYTKYNIFSNNGFPNQPYYKNPWKTVKDYYYDEFNILDGSVHPEAVPSTYTLLNSLDKPGFTQAFKSSWSSSLLPHHPEYARLVYAETQLTSSYDWINEFLQADLTTATGNDFVNPMAHDPFFVVSPGSASAMTTAMGNYQGMGISMWQVAYGDIRCKSIVNASTRQTCYTGAPNTYPPYTGFSAAENEQAWKVFRGLYAAKRNELVNTHIATTVPLPTGDENNLVTQKYTLWFPRNNEQIASQSGWDWWPSTPGSGPTNYPSGGVTPPTTTYTDRCESYIERWREQLLQCAALNSSNDKEAILTAITTRMKAVCVNGSNATYPYGSSTVAPGTPGSVTDRSFEQVIKDVFMQYGIVDNTGKYNDDYCNPFVIEWPKPYGQSPAMGVPGATTQFDTCSCSRLQQLRNEANIAGHTTTTAILAYIQATYGEEIPRSFYSQMLKACEDLIENGDTSFISLEEPIILPNVLKCDYVPQINCISCAGISGYIAEFKSLFVSPASAPPHFTATDLTPEQVSQNSNLARFINFRTGFQFDWLQYFKAAQQATPSCNIESYENNTGSTQNVICRDTKVLFDTVHLPTPDPCERFYTLAANMAHEIYTIRLQYALQEFEAAYRSKCMAAKNLEQFSVKYTNSEYHYTLYYYDVPGNLVKTVPPKGVNPDFTTGFTNTVRDARNSGDYLLTPITRPHTLITQYRYNSLNQVIAQYTPDAGKSEFWYDLLGRLVVSQNAQQQSIDKYSYTLYDALGRITEVGVKNASSGSMDADKSRDPEDLASWINAGGSRKELTITVYDEPYPPLVPQPTLLEQQNLRNRVSFTYTKQDFSDAGHGFASFYSYDIQGNVDKLLQDYHDIAASSGGSGRYKLLHYDYDLISGKVNEVAYQPGFEDAFYHRYSYDWENRLANVETSRDRILWERDANYRYYEHGPLRRIILGQQSVQGIDYAYTLQGWLKGVNSTAVQSTGNTVGGGQDCGYPSAVDDLLVNSRPDPVLQYIARKSITFDAGFTGGTNDVFETVLNSSLPPCEVPGTAGNPALNPPGNMFDMGGDGVYGTDYSNVGMDAYGFALNYFDGDYTPINNAVTPFGTVTAPLPGGSVTGQSLYNGNIASMAVNIPKLGQAHLYGYRYDQLNRIIAMDAFTGLDGSTNQWSNIQATKNYRERVSYDPNGNILSYARNGNAPRANDSGTGMDDMIYSYKPDKNQLDKVQDAAIDAAVGEYDKYRDIKQGQVNGNYQYDLIGNLVSDASEGITEIKWTVYGKIKEIIKTGGNIVYEYDAAGNRISKLYNNKRTIYVRDAMGNVIAVYESESNASPVQKESHLYGSSRIGLQQTLTVPPDEISLIGGYGTALLSTFTRGEKLYELTNHLGNVLVTISDKKMPVRKIQYCGTFNTTEGPVTICREGNYPEDPSMGGNMFPNGDPYNAYIADVITANDYYPFGMNMPGRNFNVGSEYRYGFNGKEKDKDSDILQYDYGFRIFDTRIGKFKSVDPLTQNYPALTPYQFASNSPILYIDIDGKEGGRYWTPGSEGKKSVSILLPTNALVVSYYTDKNPIIHTTAGNQLKVNARNGQLRSFIIGENLFTSIWSSDGQEHLGYKDQNGNKYTPDMEPNIGIVMAADQMIQFSKTPIPAAADVSEKTWQMPAMFNYNKALESDILPDATTTSFFVESTFPTYNGSTELTSTTILKGDDRSILPYASASFSTGPGFATAPNASGGVMKGAVWGLDEKNNYSYTRDMIEGNQLSIGFSMPGPSGTSLNFGIDLSYQGNIIQHAMGVKQINATSINIKAGISEGFPTGAIKFSGSVTHGVSTSAIHPLDIIK